MVKYAKICSSTFKIGWMRNEERLLTVTTLKLFRFAQAHWLASRLIVILGFLIKEQLIMSMFGDYQHLPEHFVDNDKIDVSGAYIMPSKLYNCFFVVRNKNSIEVEKVVETHFQRKIEAEKFIERNKT